MINLAPPIAQNYAATVIRVQNISRVPNTDRLQVIHHFGMNAIVGLDVKEGDLGLLFPAECQLSFDYCYFNNLHSHGTKRVVDNHTHEESIVQLNVDPTAKGYFGDNRRVRAITLQKVKSDALFMPLTSLNYLFGKGEPPWDAGQAESYGPIAFKEGDTFDAIDEQEICRKYLIPVKQSNGANNQMKRVSKVDVRVFPEHFESAHYFRHDRNLDPNAYVVVTQKLHGTSIRIGYVPVRRELTKFEEKLLWLREFLPDWVEHRWKPLPWILRKPTAWFTSKLWFKLEDFEYNMVYGSHHAIKDEQNPNQIHFYGTDVWSEHGKQYMGVLPENIIVYGELIGWYPAAGENDEPKALQRGYTYDVPMGQNRMYVYRVVMVNHQGVYIDLSWNQIVAFCEAYGFNPVPELWRGFVWQLQDRQVPDMGPPSPTFLETKFIERRFHDDGWHRALPLSDQEMPDEGVCVRIEEGYIQPQILKAKSPTFLQKETLWLDEGKADIESDDSAGSLVDDGLVSV